MASLKNVKQKLRAALLKHRFTMPVVMKHVLIDTYVVFMAICATVVNAEQDIGNIRSCGYREPFQCFGTTTISKVPLTNVYAYDSIKNVCLKLDRWTCNKEYYFSTKEVCETTCKASKDPKARAPKEGTIMECEDNPPEFCTDKSDKPGYSLFAFDFAAGECKSIRVQDCNANNYFYSVQECRSYCPPTATKREELTTKAVVATTTGEATASSTAADFPECGATIPDCDLGSTSPYLRYQYQKTKHSEGCMITAVKECNKKFYYESLENCQTVCKANPPNMPIDITPDYRCGYSVIEDYYGCKKETDEMFWKPRYIQIPRIYSGCNEYKTKPCNAPQYFKTREECESTCGAMNISTSTTKENSAATTTENASSVSVTASESTKINMTSTAKPFTSTTRSTAKTLSSTKSTVTTPSITANTVTMPISTTGTVTTPSTTKSIVTTRNSTGTVSNPSSTMTSTVTTSRSTTSTVTIPRSTTTSARTSTEASTISSMTRTTESSSRTETNTTATKSTKINMTSTAKPFTSTTESTTKTLGNTKSTVATPSITTSTVTMPISTTSTEITPSSTTSTVTTPSSASAVTKPSNITASSTSAVTKPSNITASTVTKPSSTTTGTVTKPSSTTTGTVTKPSNTTASTVTKPGSITTSTVAKPSSTTKSYTSTSTEASTISKTRTTEYSSRTEKNATATKTTSTETRTRTFLRNLYKSFQNLISLTETSGSRKNGVKPYTKKQNYMYRSRAQYTFRNFGSSVSFDPTYFCKWLDIIMYNFGHTSNACSWLSAAKVFDLDLDDLL